MFTSKQLSKLAEEIAIIKLDRDIAIKDWDNAKRAAIAVRKKAFASNDWQISVIKGEERFSYDGKKLDAYFKKMKIDPKKFKMSFDSGTKVLVKRISQ